VNWEKLQYNNKMVTVINWLRRKRPKVDWPPFLLTWMRPEEKSNRSSSGANVIKLFTPVIYECS